MTTASPADQAARDRIRNDTSSTLFVEAGAGTGKTTALVSRIVTLVLEGKKIERIAAITFTEAAAGELKDRVRKRLDEELKLHGSVSPVGVLCQQALRNLDGAAIQTLHAFAQRIIAAFPLEAGLPPRLEVADEVMAGIAFNEDWQQFMDELLQFDNTNLARAFRFGLEVRHLRAIAQAFGENLDRLAAAQFPERPLEFTREVVVGALDEALRLAAPLEMRGVDDKLLDHIVKLRPVLEELRSAGADDDFLLVLMKYTKFTAGNLGQAQNWGGSAGKAEAIEALKQADHERVRLVDGARTECLMPILARLQQFTLDRAEERRRRGVLQFDDLLVLARNLLRSDAVVRKAFAGRFDQILIDEFQDTDPIQVEIAALLAASVDDVEGLRWDEIPTVPGKLFFVGDPKQSIYRFRRADILLYDAASRHFGEQVALTANFRSREPILERINAIFEEFMGPGLVEGQAKHEPLTGGRPADPDDGPCVYLVGERLDTDIEEVREVEAAGLVGLISTIRESWTVDDGAGGRQPARLNDIAILLPTRYTFLAIERALETAGFPYRLESRSLLYSTQEVVDLTNLLAAIDDPTDEVSIVAALRSPAFGCADDELYAYVRAGGYWDYTGKLPELSVENPVPAALHDLRQLHEARWWLSVSEMVERVIRVRKLMEVALAVPRARETWQRLRFVLEQARGFDRAGNATLRQFVNWLRTQADEGSRVAESVVPETDDDAIRVMTVHAAKGLEFPIVLLAGLNRDPKDRTGIAIWSSNSDTPEVRVGTDRSGYFKTPRFDDLQPIEANLVRLEDIRLLYVAATRARDHLILSLYHKRPSSREPNHSHAAMTFDLAGARGWDFLPPQPLIPEEDTPPDDEPMAGDPLAERDAWIAQRARMIAANTRSQALAATTVSHQVDVEEGVEPSDKDEQDDASQPWKRGRAGTSLGRAVHAVLQTVDLETGAGLEAAARAQATAEGVPEREREIVELAKAALASAAVREAVESKRYWRELYVAADIDGTTVEGFIDLMYETRKGLVIVDYKTDSLRSDAEIEAAMARYEVQGAVYALAVEQALPGRKVANCVFVFVRPKREHAVPDLGAAMQAARGRIATAVAAGV